MLTELKPCPFCGAEAIIVYSVKDDTYVCGCGCFTSGCMGDARKYLHRFKTKEEAIAAWNRRYDDGK